MMDLGGIQKAVPFVKIGCPYRAQQKNYDNAKCINILQNDKQMKHPCRQVAAQKHDYKLRRSGIFIASGVNPRY